DRRVAFDGGETAAAAGGGLDEQQGVVGQVLQGDRFDHVLVHPLGGVGVAPVGALGVGVGGRPVAGGRGAASLRLALLPARAAAGGLRVPVRRGGGED